ncbi:MAG: YkgJ family cysteine cluster protein [Candidatus Competibacteraceae bacterium]
MSQKKKAPAVGDPVNGGIYAGSVSAWFRQYKKVLQSGGRMAANVPCAGCTACCRRYNVELGPDEAVEGLEFTTDPATGRMTLERRSDGSCVHLVEGKCAVYPIRPRACRVYDCRMYVFCGVLPPDSVEIVQRWRIDRKTEEDRLLTVALFMAVEAAKPQLAGYDSVARYCRSVLRAVAEQPDRYLQAAKKKLAEIKALPRETQEQLVRQSQGHHEQLIEEARRSSVQISLDGNDGAT